MKGKNHPKKEKKILSKKTSNIKLDKFFQKDLSAKVRDNKNIFENKNITTNKQYNLIRNPFNSKSLEEIQNDLKKYHSIAEKTILIDYSLVDIFYSKLLSAFEKIHYYSNNNKKYEINQINNKELIIKFILQLKYINIIYIHPCLLSNEFKEDIISENIKNFSGYNNYHHFIINSFPNTKKESQIFLANIYNIISNYLESSFAGRGLYLYIKHDYISYLDKIKLVCNLYNFELTIIDESNVNKNLILEQVSEAMHTKRLPGIPELIDLQMLILEEMVNNFSFKWKIYLKQNGVNKNNNNNFNNINNNIYKKINTINNSSNIINLSSESCIENEIINISSFSYSNLIENSDTNNLSEYSVRMEDNNINKNELLSTNNNSLINNNIENNNRIIYNNINDNIKDEDNEKIELFNLLKKNIFSFCNKAKTAILILDSFSNGEKDKKYFNNILAKISQTKCPVIILTNNLNNILNCTPKRLKNLEIKSFLFNKNIKNNELIYLYNFIIYLNIKLISLKLSKSIKTYEDLLDYINKINIDKYSYELNNTNLENLSKLSEYFCYKGKFQIDIIDLRLSEIFSIIEKEIENKLIDSNDFINTINYIYNLIFHINNQQHTNFSLIKRIEDIYQESELLSFIDYFEKKGEDLIESNYEHKLLLNNDYENFIKSNNSMVNLEKLTLEKYLINKKTFFHCIKNENAYKTKYYLFNNNILNKLYKEDQLFLSICGKKFISSSSLKNYIYPLTKIIIEKRNKNKNLLSKLLKESNIKDIINFLNVHEFNKYYRNIHFLYFLQKNYLNYASNYAIKKTISKKKINFDIYE